MIWQCWTISDVLEGNLKKIRISSIYRLWQQTWTKVFIFIHTSVPKCYHVLNWFFPSKTWFFKIYLNFQRQKSLKKSISPTFWIQILANKFHLNPAHQDLSNNIKGTFQFLRKFLFNLIFNEEIIQYSRTFDRKSKHHETNLMHPSSSRAFQRHQERDLKHPGSVDLTSTNKAKQTNYPPS